VITWPAVVLFGGIGIVVPAAFYFIFRRRGGLTKIPAWVWTVTGLIAFLFFPAFLFRKHYEAALVFAKNTFWFVAGIVQMDNNIWEELAKVLAILVFLALARKTGPEVFRRKSGATIWGFWTGLCYGIGEAITLSIIGYLPKLGRVFGVSLFLYFTTWHSVWERAYAIQLHAIMGALIGLGFYHWFGLKKRWWLLFFFFVATLYHELVDGLVLVMKYYPGLEFSRFARTHILTVILPLLLIIGYLAVLVAYKNSRRHTSEVALENTIQT